MEPRGLLLLLIAAALIKLVFNKVEVAQYFREEWKWESQWVLVGNTGLSGKISDFPSSCFSVPEVTKPSLSQPVAASPIGNSPSPPVNGGNNAKRVAVPNGQPPSAARYMPREVPPRFRCQQDHKVLLKRGQPPPPSCMLLGGGAGPPPPTAPGANPNNAQPVTGALLQNDSGTATGK